MDAEYDPWTMDSPEQECLTKLFDLGFSPLEASAWLDAIHPQLGGKTPMQKIEADEVSGRTGSAGAARDGSLRLRALAAVLLLACSCAVGSAGYDEHGKPYAWGLAALHAKIESCEPEAEKCVRVDAQGLSKNASDVVRSEGFLSGAWSVTKWVAGKALGWLF